MAVDLLSHSGRFKIIHLFTLDSALAADVSERVHSDSRLKKYQVIKPHISGIDETVAEIDKMSRETVSAKIIILDVRRDTLTLLKKPYNKIIGYNRRDLNRTVFTVLIGDGPANLIEKSSLDTFVPYLSALRVDYSPAVFFFDPLLHHQLDEESYKGIEDKFVIPEKLPKRLIPYFKIGAGEVTTEAVRKFFRSPAEKNQRLQVLLGLFKKRIAKQFPNENNERLNTWLSKEGLQLASERLNLYPLFFEDWIHELIEKPAPK
jgi:hypothetical protein